MADSKISNLTLVTTLDGADVLPIVNGGSTKKVTVTKIQEGLATTTYVDTQDALKVDKVAGKGLSTEDYTTTEKSKLAGIASGAEVNVNADWNAVSGDAQILNKPTIPSTSTLVPYTGATANVDLGEFELKAGQITLDTTPTGTPAVATTRWNDSLGSSETTLKGGTVILKNGVDLVARIVNKVTPNTTLTKANYQAVRVSGATGQRLSVELAQGDTDLKSADTIGLVTETIATNQEGFIITMGQIENINTTGSLQSETWADGDVLYLSPTVAGRLTNIKPTGATGHIVVIGYVEYAHANNGKIYVKIMNGWELDELHNVYINSATLANNDLLQYELSTQLWKNKQLTSTSISDFNSATRSQVESELVAGTNITITPSGTGATRQLTIASSGGGSSSQSAYTVLANNTNASAVPTEQGFRNEPSKAYTGTTPAWTGTTAPTTVNNLTYSWSRIGNVVTLRVSLDYATAGTAVSIVAIDLPSDCPTPELPSGVATALNVICYGVGTLAGSKGSVATMGTTALRLKTISPNTFDIQIQRASGNYAQAYATIQYFV